MLINHKNLIGLRVVTKSDVNLGFISGFEFNTESQQIENYFVKRVKIFSGFIKERLVINKKQIVLIDNEKMIVDDLVGLQTSEESESNFIPVQT